MTESISIVGGCGHVGLPLGIAFTLAGLDVTLIDVNEDRLKAVEAGRMPFYERGADEALPKALATGRLHTARSLSALADSTNVIVTIGTPVDEFLDPAVRTFDRSMDRVLERMRAGHLLVLRSTVFPGVTERLSRLVTQRRLGIDVVHCPERIAQGYALEEIAHLPQIVGGASRRATDRAKKLFAALGVRILELSATEAELAKLFANSYRYINFAISNQFYLIAQKFHCDFHRIHQAVTLDYPRMVGFAKAGLAGGPCLLKDTMQLGAFNHHSFLLGQAAMMINEGLPYAMVEAAKSHMDLTEKTAAILGMAFKGNCDDERDSLAYKLRKILQLECREVLCTDPYIADPDFVPLQTAVDRADILFVSACHAEYRNLRISKPVIDVFDFLPRTGSSLSAAA